MEQPSEPQPQEVYCVVEDPPVEGRRDLTTVRKVAVPSSIHPLIGGHGQATHLVGLADPQNGHPTEVEHGVGRGEGHPGVANAGSNN